MDGATLLTSTFAASALAGLYPHRSTPQAVPDAAVTVGMVLTVGMVVVVGATVVSTTVVSTTVASVVVGRALSDHPLHAVAIKTSESRTARIRAEPYG